MLAPLFINSRADAAHLADGFIAPIDDPDTNAVQISTPEELDQIRNNLNGSYVLVNDIDISNYEWTPIGKTLSEPFRGKLDGQGFTISGLQVESNFTAGTLLPPSYAVGLFGVCDGAQIKNIRLQNVSVNITNSSGYRYDLTNIDSGSLYAGAFVGYAIGNTVLYNCFVSDGTVFAMATGEAQSCPHAGGLIGFSKESIVSFCYNKSSVSASYNSGLFGFDTYTGGLIAFTSGDGAIDRSFNSGSVTTDMGDFGTGYAGGLVGVSKDTGVAIADCFNEGSVSVRVGAGLFGSENAYAGGIAASFAGEISRVYNSGSIRAQNNDPIGIGSGNSFAGGICAQAESNAEIQSTLMLSADVTVTGGKLGGAYAYCIANEGNKNNTAVIEGVPQGVVNDAAWKISASDARSQEFYEEQLQWDFSTVWEFIADKSYPQLKATDLGSEDYENKYLSQHLQFIAGSSYENFLNSQRWAQIYWSEENNFKSNLAGALYEVIDGIITGDNLKFSKLLGEDSLYQVILADYVTDQSVKAEIEKSFEEKLPQTIEKTYDSVKKFISENWKDAWGELSDEDIFYLLHYNEKPAEVWINENFEEHLDEIVYNDRHGLAEALEISADNLDKVLDAKVGIEKTVEWFGNFAEYSANINAYLDADDEFQTILKKMLDHIPEDDLINANLLEKAIKDYTEFDDEDGIGQLFLNFIGGEVISGIGDNISKWIDSKISNWLDEILPDGAKSDLSILGWVAEKTWKICELVTQNGKLNDCRQMLHSNAFFEATLFETMQEIKDDFLTNQTLENAELFDAAFKFFKEVQLYSMDICISYFDTYQTAWLPAIRHQSNTFLNSAIEEVQYNKLTISNTYCHGTSYFVGGKVITIACPTDVFLFDENEEIAAEIVNNEVTECAENISACTIDNVKIIAVPLDQDYRIQIKGTGTGYMDYSISEYDTEKCLSRATVFEDVPVNKGGIYVGIIKNETNVVAEEYALSSTNSSTPILPSEVIQPENLVPVQNVYIHANKTSFVVGDTIQLDCEIIPHNASVQSLVWHSSDSNIVSISEEGQVNAIAEGEAIITAQSIYGGNPGQITLSVRGNQDVQVPEETPDGNEDGDNASSGEDDVVPDNTSPSGSGNSSSSGDSALPSSNHYTVSVSGNIANGSISVSPSRAERGDTVTITVDPDEGYELDTLIVTDSNGNRITTEKESDTRYTFEMPRGRVSIDATFIAIKEESVPQPSGEPFTDVSSHDWFYDAVVYTYGNGLMNGTSNILFDPSSTTTRAMIVTILHRLEGEPHAVASSFTDVAPNMYYADAVAWAQENGIVNGTSTTVFSPNDPITREQMAAILYRYAQFKEHDVSPIANLSAYRDVSRISSYALPAMQWANAKGLIVGDTSVTINPLGSATRAEVATILMRFCKSIDK